MRKGNRRWLAAVHSTTRTTSTYKIHTICMYVHITHTQCALIPTISSLLWSWAVSVSSQACTAIYNANDFSLVYVGAVGIFLHIHLKPHRAKRRGGWAERDLLNKESLAMQNIIQNLFFKAHLHFPQPSSLTSPVQEKSVCQSTFCMWFITTHITVHLKTT